MIRQRIRLDGYRWTISVCYAIDHFEVNAILDELIGLGCDKDELVSARELLTSQDLDSGLTYSNIEKGQTLVVIGACSAPNEFANSLTHEIGHVAQHISRARGLDPYGEEICYLMGSIAEVMHPMSHLLLGDCGCARRAILSMLEDKGREEHDTYGQHKNTKGHK